MDLTLPITGGTVLLGMLTLTAYLLKLKVDRFDKHLEDCQTKSVNHARLEEKVIRIEGKLDDMKEAMTARTSKIDAMDEKLDQLATIITKRGEL